MNRATLHEVPSDTLRDAAAAWYERRHDARRHGNDEAEFEQWISSSSEHRAAYEAIDRTWAALKSVAHDPQILALRHETALRLTRRTHDDLRPLRWIAAALLVSVLGAALGSAIPRLTGGHSVFAWLSDKLGHGHDGTYITTTGERLNVVLDDGSQVTLNTQTEMTVAYTRAYRTIHIARGQAFFEVAKDPSRPFVVEAQDRRLVAVGTAFDVRIQGSVVKVTMLAGTVRAEGFNAGRPLQTTLTVGEQLIAQNRAPDDVRRADPERVSSWRHGRVIFDDTRLGEAIEEMNRYSDRHVELADAKLADLRLSGAFTTGGLDLFVEAITTYFPIQVDHADNQRVFLTAR